MKDKDVEHPEDHHDQHEFLAQSRIVAPPYFEPWFLDGWMSIYKKLTKGDVDHFFMVETVGRGEDHNTYILYGC